VTGSGGRHSSPEGSFPPGRDAGFGVPRYEPSRYEVPPYVTGGSRPVGREPGPAGQTPRVLDRYDDVTGRLTEPDWWSDDSSDRPQGARRSGAGRNHPGGWGDGADDLPPSHPSAPLPPRPQGAWEKLRPRQDTAGDDAQTVAAPLLPGGPLDTPARRGQTSGPVGGFRASDDADDDLHDDAATEAHLLDPDGPSSWEDRTGGLDVIGTHVGDDEHRRRGRRQGSGRRRRRPVAAILSLLVLAALVVGIVLGGQKLIQFVDPTAEDYAGQGGGDISVRVQNGDTLSDIARTLVEADVIASVEPFVDAAESNAASVGIQPGVYSMRLQMSGQAALDQLLDPASRRVSRVTLPEGLTVERALERIAEETGRPVEEYQAAAADTAALGLPAYANGQLEGFLFPATYDVEPDTAPADVLRQMVQQFTEVAARLRLEQRAAAAGRSPTDVVTVASMIQSETRLDAERPDVGQVIYNRLDQGIALGIDATLAFGLDKNGNELTADDLRTDSPYNTRTRTGLPPTAISSPGEASLEAALAPSSGDLLYYVLETAEGRHFFTSDYAEFQAARQRCADAGLGCGG
jgi:UPF0755 protein